MLSMGTAKGVCHLPLSRNMEIITTISLLIKFNVSFTGLDALLQHNTKLIFRSRYENEF